MHVGSLTELARWNTHGGVGTALGEIPTGNCTKQNGRNPDLDTAFETVWAQGGLYPWSAQTAATALTIQSSDNTDDVKTTGDGAQTATIYGLDGNWLLQSESVDLNGTTSVDLANTYRRVYKVDIFCGSNGYNTGAITVTDGSANVWASVVAGGAAATAGYTNTSEMCIFTVPANRKGILTMMNFTTTGNASATVTLQLLVRDNSVGNPTWHNERTFTFDGNTEVDIDWSTHPLRLLPKMDLQFIAKCSSTNAILNAGFDVIMKEYEA